MRPITSASRTAVLLVAVLSLTLGSRTARAATETFDYGFTLNSSNSIGDASLQGGYFGIGPVSTPNQILLTTISTAGAHDPGPNQSGTNAVSVTAMAAFLGIPTTTIRDGVVTGQEGSVLQLNIGSVVAGTIISFNYDFLTNETDGGAHTDFAFVALVDSVNGINGNTPVVSDIFAPLSVTTGAGNPFALETGYQTYSFVVGTTGTYSLGIGVTDGTTTDTSSALLVDNVSVPEGGTSVVLLVIALAAVEGLRRLQSLSRAPARTQS